jgi:hypothetical protein
VVAGAVNSASGDRAVECQSGCLVMVGVGKCTDDVRGCLHLVQRTGEYRPPALAQKILGVLSEMAVRGTRAEVAAVELAAACQILCSVVQGSCTLEPFGWRQNSPVIWVISNAVAAYRPSPGAR